MKFFVTLFSLLVVVPTFAMNKGELIDAIAKDANLTKKQAREFVNAYQKEVVKSLKKEGQAKMTGFGSLKCKEKANKTKCQRVEFDADYSYALPHMTRYVDSVMSEITEAVASRSAHQFHTCSNGVDDDCDGPTRATDHNSSRSNKTSSISIISTNLTDMYQEFDFYTIYSPDEKARIYAKRKLAEAMVRSIDQISKLMPREEDREELMALAQTGVDSFFDVITRALDDDSDGDSIDDEIFRSSGLSKADAKRALESFISITTEALKKGDKISLVGFGTFSISKRAARTGRNPQTGKEIKIAAKNVVGFKGNPIYKETTNSGSNPIFE